jgi:hypothetical protein
MVHLEDIVGGDDWLGRLDPHHAPDARSGPAVGPAGQRDGDLALALDEPQSYQLPWNRDHALSLQAAQYEAGEQGMGTAPRGW